MLLVAEFGVLSLDHGSGLVPVFAEMGRIFRFEEAALAGVGATIVAPLRAH